MFHFLIALVASFAYACPQLEGHYNCHGYGFEFSLDVTRFSSNGVDTYVILNNQGFSWIYQADGKTTVDRRVRYETGGGVHRTNASCLDSNILFGQYQYLSLPVGSEIPKLEQHRDLLYQPNETGMNISESIQFYDRDGNLRSTDSRVWTCGR